jgi:hypothetical protein
MSMSLNNLYVIVYWMEWIGMSLNSDTVYPTKEEAEAKIVELNKTDFAVKEKIKYRILSVSEYVREAQSQAVADAVHPIE